WRGARGGGASVLRRERKNGTEKPQMGILVAHLSAPAGDFNGTPGPDSLSATGNLLHAFGNDGNDQLFFTGNQNQLSGGNGDDSLHAIGVNNYLYGNAGNDWLGVPRASNQPLGGAGNRTSCGDHQS